MSTISARATSKRARLDEEPVQEGRDGEDVGSVPRDNTPAETETRRDEEFWFDDGTVILVARDVEFRVYSGILGNKSPVFRELFSQPRPTRLVSIHSLPEIPCSVVTLTDDPDDLRHILRIYMAHTVTGGSLYDAKSPSFDAISASIRLGHKYQMTELHDQSLAYLKYHFTDDFDVWEHHPEWCPSGWRSEEAIGVVNLARLIGEPYLLPTALLVCIELGDELVEGYAQRRIPGEPVYSGPHALRPGEDIAAASGRLGLVPHPRTGGLPRLQNCREGQSDSSRSEWESEHT